ncbi:NADH-quinone oxidoreductase subunit L [Prolixibacter sp. NT017]|uniref:NADH-quinone oxidoreductase subunit L n=1 Tax=Prolixibacter sp. NT017 TaxID=2652390 RepID=UPI001288A1FB|nr:NADH-quinone oxidoreductase subunit L [Prolixibacter sp. NT017]GET25915.1 NADH dehydrogenase subunit L [Prolixibacter sp. NT017]
MTLDNIVLLIPLLPLLSFLLLGLAGKHISVRFSGVIGSVILGASLVLALVTAYDYFFAIGKQGGEFIPYLTAQLNWLPFNSDLSINLGLVLDPISVMMLLVVTFVSTMVHIYSLGYMKGEERYTTYYAYLGLFTFSMLGLVLSTNIFQMYIFWELVGVSSYLLIGFYFSRPSAVAAAKKAFIVTRFADLGFLIGILMLGYGAHSYDFFTLIDRLSHPGSSYLVAMTGASFLGMSTLTWALILVFIGGAGKSAMFPFHIWLPDAMEGPTPISALIHAATMVVAGVYLVARLFPIFAVGAPDALTVVGYVGAFTALFAATIACTQTDIKKVLAYSTISQIGFMLFALGVAGWGPGKTEGFTAGMFHLFTHASFKALLFLGAGSIIHAVHSNEMKDMGGLRKSMPITHITFLLAALAISGIPPFAGFFSKEAIFSAAEQSNPIIYWVGLIAGTLTAFYIFRLYFMIFWHKTPDAHAHNHEKGEWAMMIPMMLLAVGAVFGGFIPFGDFVSATGKPLALPIELSHIILPVGLGVLSIVAAAILYRKESDVPQRIVNALGGFYRAAYRKFYIDEIYLFITKKIVFKLMGRPSAWFDRNVVDGTVQKTGSLTIALSNTIKRVQSGKLQAYTMYFFGGVLLLVVLLLYKFA